MVHHSDKYRRLARKAWKAAHGPIPKGHQIHHRDLDDTNFALDNLQCLTIVEHRRIHRELGGPHKVCLCCGKGFQDTWENMAKFCSNACKSAARRASGVDNVERACAKCAKLFTANRYSKQRFCCRICADPGTYDRHRL